MRIVPFRFEDYARIDLANGVGLEHWNLLNGVFPILKYMESSGTFWTIWDEERVIAIAGYSQFWSGVCEVSFYPSRQFVKRPMAIYRLLRKELFSLRQQFRRIQLHCRADECFVRFATHLGFEEEGRMKKFDHQDRDHLLMAIVR